MVDRAKDFLAKDHLDRSFSLSDYKGQKIWLAFYRYASCPLCNLHINQIINRFDEFKKRGVVFLPVFQSSSGEVMKYAGERELPFRIICDPDEELYKLYNVGHSYSGFFSLSMMCKIVKAMAKGFMPGKMEGEISRLPSEFIINENYEISFRYDGKDIGDHPSLDLIIENLK